MIDKDTIIRLARVAGGTPYTNRHLPGETAVAFGPGPLQDFAQAIYRQGLEDAAKIVEQKDMDYYGIVPAIRALGEQQ